jgi:hypothetical protein
MSFVPGRITINLPNQLLATFDRVVFLLMFGALADIFPSTAAPTAGLATDFSFVEAPDTS